MVTAIVVRGLLIGAGLAGVVAAAASQGPAAAAPSDFVGSTACGSCHSEIYQRWAVTAHARAEESLGGLRGSPRCQACHSTGEAPAGRRLYPGVGCESCHGPGAAYQPEDVMRSPSLSRALGLRDLSTPERRAAVCASCHRALTRLAPFDAEAAWQRIAH